MNSLPETKRKIKQPTFDEHISRENCLETGTVVLQYNRFHFQIFEKGNAMLTSLAMNQGNNYCSHAGKVALFYKQVLSYILYHTVEVQSAI